MKSLVSYVGNKQISRIEGMPSILEIWPARHPVWRKKQCFKGGERGTYKTWTDSILTPNRIVHLQNPEHSCFHPSHLCSPCSGSRRKHPLPQVAWQMYQKKFLLTKGNTGVSIVTTLDLSRYNTCRCTTTGISRFIPIIWAVAGRVTHRIWQKQNNSLPSIRQFNKYFRDIQSAISTK